MAARTRKGAPRTRSPKPAPVVARSRVRVTTAAVAALALVTVGIWAYSPSFRGVFVLDDVRAIVRNPTIRSLWPLSVPLEPPTASTVAGRPVANLSFALNLALAPGAPGMAGALDPAPFHVGNLVIHLAAALVLFGVVRRTLASEPLRAGVGPGAPWIALVIALVWAVHPLQTAAVTYIVQRVESLMGLFYLLTLYCSIRGAEKVGSDPTFVSPASRRWAAAAIAFCACGMGTKEVMVTAPIMVAAWDHLFGERGADGVRPTRWGLLGGLASTWLILAALVAYEHRTPSVSLSPGTVWQYLLTQAEVVVHYLHLVFVPAQLAFLYDWPLASSPGAVAWPAALLVALLLLTAVGIARRHPASFLGAWFFLILAPSSSFLPILTEVAAEHRMYLPLAAIVSAVVLGLFALGRTLLRAPKAAVAACAIMTALVVGVLGLETRARNRVYWSAEGLWQDTVTKRPNDARPRVAHGEALASAGRLADAESELRIGVALEPESPAAQVRLGVVLAQQRKFEEAVPHLERALALRPGDVDAHRFLAEIYAVQHQDRLAVEHSEQALAVLPADGPLMAGLATLLLESRDMTVRNPPRARELAERAVRLTARRDPRMMELLSAAQAASGQFADAAATARAAAEVARGRGDRQLTSALEHRASTYDSAARQFPGPHR